MDYWLVQTGNPVTLENAVRKRMLEGWECQGGVAVICNAGTWLYLQAMVKK